MIKFAVISFPGTNCENETVRAFKRAGMDAEMVLWNDEGMLNKARLDEFDGYAIAGGFSYEDRGRSGVVAAQDPITEILKEEADKGKVVIGICNGAQVLVETGLVPGFDNKELGVALAWNEMKKDGEIIGTSFYNAWIHLKSTALKNRNAFNNFDELLHIPTAHGEGRFVVNEEILEKLEANNQIVFKYADETGEVKSEFPHCPNGATASIAAISNPAGNVMAIMPHPERDPIGNGELIFKSIKSWIEESKKADHESLGDYTCDEIVTPLETKDVEIFVRLIIADNTERTIEEALIRKGYDIGLARYIYYGINLEDGVSVSDAVAKIIDSGELANLNKHVVYVRTSEGTFVYDKDSGLQQKDLDLDSYVIACDQKDFVGENKASLLNAYTGNMISDVQHGTLWNFVEGGAEIDEVIKSKVLYNPHSMYLMKS